jgi:hypothetical protein
LNLPFSEKGIDQSFDQVLYFLRMAYYSGENIFDIVSAAEVKKSGAKLFQGCAMSNKVRFVV